MSTKARTWGTGILLVVCVASRGWGQPFDVPGTYPTIQDAIEASFDGEEILVAPGIYNEGIDFLGKAVTIRSAGGPTATMIDATSLQVSAVVCASGEEADSVLEGFTVTRGDAPTGGGIRIVGARPTVKNCRFVNNVALTGGGVSIAGGSPVFQACEFTLNFAFDGGGIALFQGASATFVGCDFQNNLADHDGGALWVFEGNRVTFINCRVSANEAIAGEGGGIRYSNGSTLDLINCLVTANRCAGSGAGLRGTNSVTTILSQCTVSQNSGASPGRAIRVSEDSNCTLQNTIIWNNGGAGSIAAPPGSFLVFRFSNVEGGVSGSGNIEGDPLFVDSLGPDGQTGTGDEDFRLGDGSPCIDSGANLIIPADFEDLDEDGDVLETVPFDLSGFSRIVDATVDMGAYEFGAVPTGSFIRGDADGNGDFSGVPDGVFVLSFQFVPGSFPPPCFDAADADDSGDVSGLVDGIFIMNFQFVPGSPSPPPPGPVSCGFDATIDPLGCDNAACP